MGRGTSRARRHDRHRPVQGPRASICGERIRFLGDAMVLVQDIPTQTGVHPLEPIAMAVQRQLYALAHTWFERPGLEPGDVAHLTTALGSALAGVLFVFTAWGIARELV